MKFLVIAAHPDDEVLGCGGTIARLCNEGHEGHISILGEGISSRYPNREMAPVSEIENLQRRSRQAASFLGVKNIFFSNLPDNRFDTIPLLEIVKIIEEQIRIIQPEFIFTHHNGDLNIDHVLVARATLTATRPLKGFSVKTVYSYEVPSATDWAFQKLNPMFLPNVFFDITASIDKKIQAMQIYDSERREFPHPRSPESLHAQAIRWGSITGTGSAEAFELIREIR